MYKRQDMESAKSIRKEAKKHGIDLLLIRQKHLGSDCLPNHIDGMCEALRERGVSIRTGEEDVYKRQLRG